MSKSTYLLERAAHYLQDARGNVAVIFGLACLTLTTGAGIAVDFSRGAHQQTALASAVDAAALAVASSDQSDQTALEQLAADYIDKNFPHLKYPGSDIELDVEITDNLVRLTARQVMPTTILRTVNIETMDLEAFAEVTRRASGLEVVLVLDNTGSMNSGGKLASLKTAATELTNILFGDSTVSTAVKVGVVPFSASVNVGPQYTSATWLDHTGLNPISHLHFSDPAKHNSWAWLQLANMDWNGCVEQRKAGGGVDYDVDDTTPTTGTPDTLFPIYFAPDEPSNANQASSKSGWGSGFVNSYLSDWRSNESVSSSTKNNTSLSDRQRRHQKYEGTSPTGAGPAYQCKIGPITPLTGTKQTVLDAIDDMIADGGTNIASGVGWGLRVLSPTVPFTEGTAYDDEDWNKVMIVMTDGENDWGSALSNMNNSYYGGYGYTSQSLTRLGIGFISNRDAVYNDRTAVACAKAKAASTDPDKPIVIYTITFGSLASGAGTLMQACATDPDKYFHAPSNADLQTVFTDIATQISDLYLSQ